ncbi:MAG: hypothetical protein OXF98_05660 [Rhodospirillaceae bacterium]|nr:hypothetical protein [Rhodospirillaceae bacterium]
MHAIRFLPAWTALVVALACSGAVRAQVQVVFVPATWIDKWDTGTYRGIWDEYGERIVTALEARTCMPFPEAFVVAVVAEAVSHSGGPEHAMRLRASYPRSIKQSTLVHELGHRHLWQLEERLDDVDGHMTLSLFLDRVWADVWGEAFADERVQGESDWGEPYAHAWAWVHSLAPRERERLWNRLLVMNGYPGGCRPLLGGAGLSPDAGARAGAD